MLKPVPIPGKPKSDEIIGAFIAGAPKDAQGFVFYGVKEGNAAEWHRVRSSGAPFYFIDNSYFDRGRGAYYRVTRNKIQHDGKGQSDGHRLKVLGVQVKPERYASPPGWVLAIPQSPVFMQHTARARGWLEAALERFEADGPNGPTIVRVRPWQSDKLASMSTLQADLARASWLVTHSSAAAVEAVCAGVQVVVSPMSCAYSMGPTLPSEVERKQWAEVLADNQFTLAEMRSGYAWRAIHG